MSDGDKSQCKGPGVGMRENNNNKNGPNESSYLRVFDLSDRPCPASCRIFLL